MVNLFVEIDRKEIMGCRTISISDEDDLVGADFVSDEALACSLDYMFFAALFAVRPVGTICGKYCRVVFHVNFLPFYYLQSSSLDKI